MPRRKREWKALEWFRVVDIRGCEWKVYLTTPDITPELVGNRGVTMIWTYDVYIDASMDIGLQNRTMVHELLHVAWNDSRRSKRSEEKIVRSLEDKLAFLLGSVGFNFAPRPMGYKRLHAHGVALANLRNVNTTDATHFVVNI